MDTIKSDLFVFSKANFVMVLHISVHATLINSFNNKMLDQSVIFLFGLKNKIQEMVILSQLNFRLYFDELTLNLINHTI